MILKKNTVADLILLFVAFIWGTTFVVVQNAIDILPPNSFNGLRFLMASIILLPVIIIKYRGKRLNLIDGKGIKAGLYLGFLLFAGYSFQTVGLLYTSASKAGFITGLSVVLVPFFSILILKIMPKLTAIFGVVMAAIGLYLMTMVDISGLSKGDLYIFFCAIFFALHIIYTGKFAPHYPSLILAWIQITVVSLLSLIFGLLFEDLYHYNFASLLTLDVIIALLITAIFATAFAFLAQTAFQKFTTPTRTALIFTMEPVFAALTAFIVQNEVLSLTALIGAIFIFIGMIFAELPEEMFYLPQRLKHILRK